MEKKTLLGAFYSGIIRFNYLTLFLRFLLLSSHLSRLPLKGQGTCSSFGQPGAPRQQRSPRQTRS